MELEPFGSPDFSISGPALFLLHLPHVVLAHAGDTCPLFSGAWDGFSPFANAAKATVCVTALPQDTASEAQERSWMPSDFSSASIPSWPF